MPPKTAWEWLEGYGNMNMKGEDVFGSWYDAVAKTTAAIDALIPETELDRILKETHDSVALKKGKVVIEGSGWGALEEKRRGAKLAPQLDFSNLGKEQEAWLGLLENHRIGQGAPISYQVGEEWFRLLRDAEESWQKHYHLALNYYRRKDLERAENEVGKAGPMRSNRHLLHLLANIRRLQKRFSESADLILQAGKLDLRDRSFLKETLKMLLELEAYDKILELGSLLDAEIGSLPLIEFMRANALAHTGKLAEAEAILLKNGGLEIPDIREGENSTSGLYLYIQEQKAKRDNIPFAAEKIKVPFELDLRMSK